MTTLPAAMRPIQAYTSHNNSPIPSPQKTPRRVLGELTPNAKLTPKYQQPGAKSPVKKTPLQSPLRTKEALLGHTALSAKENNVLGSTSGSRKRPFSAIESPERLDATRSHIERLQDRNPKTVSPAALRYPLPPPVTAIDVLEENSSTDEDESLKTSSGSDVDYIELPTATQRTTGSFSSLIDYNPDNASDKSDPATVSPPSSQSSSVPVTSHVELLKLRLRIAMYKINTNQTLVPFARLKPPQAKAAEALDTDLEEQEDELFEYASPAQPPYVHPALEREAAEQKHDSQVTPKNIIIKGGPVAKLLEGPVLAPTAYSTRFIGAPDIPASPPRRSSENTFGQQTTPAGSPSRRHGADDRDLTSSVVKGHAASGLLELAHSR